LLGQKARTIVSNNSEKYVEQTDLDLKIWKELAISKQLLIKTATDVLGISSECSDEELKAALEENMAKVTEADERITNARVENEAKLHELQQQLRSAELAKKLAEEENAELKSKVASAESAMDANKHSTAQEIQKLRAQVEEKSKALKKVNTVLADTPENVAKKLKSLNKKKHDENAARKKAEDDARGLRKTKAEQQAEIESLKEQEEKLKESVKALKDFSETQRGQLIEAVDDDTTVDELPELDEDVLNAIEEEEAEAA
tara:strand:- start:11067 stop:11846 length:780 start_codon:yes stop_codon:yes gene_type:complete